jgi:transposase-like protein
MTITIDIYCPQCHSPNLSQNGKKSKGNQNYLGKNFGRKFISSHEITYRGCLPEVVNLVNIMLVRGMGIRDISTILKISITKVLKVLKSTRYTITPRFLTMIVLK